jgi:iron complex outermembrane receptor protein
MMNQKRREEDMGLLKHSGRRSALALSISGLFSALPMKEVSAQLASGPAPVTADHPGKLSELPTVDVIGTTLLPRLGTALRDVPANLQIHTQDELSAQAQNNLIDYLEQNSASITVNAAQGNPFQPDVSFRGFTASPLLGVPQGLSVFQDGVRINEAFGDVVNWGLIPQSAISSIQLIPGSNPLFGLNTLGGAVAIYTKSGRANPGGSAQASGGSAGRRAAEFEHGGNNGNWDYFFTGSTLRDRGWAEHNPSRVSQFFGKLGYQTGDTNLDFSTTLADTTLQGNQTLPLSFAGNIRQAYTFPDQNSNKLNMVTFKGSHVVNDDWLVGGNLYRRNYRNQSISSNVNANFVEGDPATGMNSAAQATNNRSAIDQASHGAGLQLTYLGRLANKKNQLMIGASADFGKARFNQDSQDAQFNANRGADPADPFMADTDAQTRNRYYGLFVSESLSLDDRWTLTLSGRYNLARIQIEDRSGSDPQLNASHGFARFNPAIGLNFNPTPDLTTYASYNEGMRAPTPIELTCADPGAPCKLPNSFLSDPPLKKVVSRTTEVGARGKLGVSTTWSAAAYQTQLTDDIQFISSQGAGSNSGFFQNVGDTRRRGMELNLSGKWRKLTVTTGYSYIDATYQSAFRQTSPANSSADATGSISVSPGNQIPGIPRHNLKLRIGFEASKRWSIGANILHSGASHARGDENNADAAGKVPQYTVINLDTRFKLAKNLEFFGRINNIFDRTYANFGLLGRNVFTGPERSFNAANPVNEQFRGYGAPRGIWIGLRTSWS